MIGSWIGRMLVALPGILASVAIGLIAMGLTLELGLSAALVALLVGVVLLRASSTGVIIDLEREQLVLRTFWRSRRLSVEDLRRIDARMIGEGWPPGVRFVTVDGREHGSLALCYLDEARAEVFIDQLEALAGPAAEVSLSPASFRPSVS